MAQQILLVDDESSMLALISIILKRGGYATLEAHDAFAALEMLDAAKPDLIVLDVMMPNMNGIELCRRIRIRPDTARTPILIVSAKSDADSMRLGIRAGANDYLPKEELYPALLSRVRSLLDA